MFHKCASRADVKTLFRKLALLIHPDKGGEVELMILLQESYEMALAYHEVLDREESKEKKPPRSNTQTAVEDIISGDERLLIINKIIKYAVKHPKFNTSFVESIEEFLEEKGYITAAQFNALNKVFFAFRMDREDEE